MGVAVNVGISGKRILINKEFSKAYSWLESELIDVEIFFENVYPDH
jgi:hypothetical protein